MVWTPAQHRAYAAYADNERRRHARVAGGGVDPLTLLQAKGVQFLYHDFLTRTDLTFQDVGGIIPADGASEAIALAVGSDQIGTTSLSDVLTGATELAIDGTFSAGISQVTAKRNAVLAWNGSNRLSVEHGGSPEPQGWLTLATTAGVPVQVRLDVEGGPATGIVRGYAADQSTILASTGSLAGGTNGLIFTPTGSTSYLSLGANTSTLGAKTYYDNVSVKSVPGYHATQSANTSYRPTRQADASVKGDGLDDNLLSRLTSSTSMFMAVAMLGGANPASFGTLIGGPVGTSRGYFGRNSSGQLCAGVGTDSIGTIVGGGDLSGLKGVAMLNVDAVAGTVDLEWMPKGGAFTSLYSSGLNGAITAGTALRLWATNASGTAGNFGTDYHYFAAATQASLTPAERLGFAKAWNARIPS